MKTYRTGFLLALIGNIVLARRPRWVVAALSRSEADGGFGN